MAWFRSPKYLEKVDYERIGLDTDVVIPANGQFQAKKGYKFSSRNRDIIYDWFNAYVAVEYRFEAKADGANVGVNDETAPVNGSFSLINRLTVRSAGKSLYQADGIHKVVFIKTMLEDSKDYAESVAEDEFWYLDTAVSTVTNPADAGFANQGILERHKLSRGAGTVKTVIPLKRFSFFEELWNRLPPVQLEFEIEFQDDAEMIYQGDGTARRIVVKKLFLWTPKLSLSPEGQKMMNEQFLKPSKWTFLQETLTSNTPQRNKSGEWHISPAVKSAKHVSSSFSKRGS